MRSWRTWMPPNSASPRYQDHAEGIRYWFEAKRQHAVQVPKHPSIITPSDAPLSPYEHTDVLHVERVWARAPYVDRPFVYQWRVAVDEDGEWVSGSEVDLVYVVSEFDWISYRDNQFLDYDLTAGQVFVRELHSAREVHDA